MKKCIERKCCDCPINLQVCRNCTLNFATRTPMDVYDWLVFNGKLKLSKKRVLNELEKIKNG